MLKKDEEERNEPRMRGGMEEEKNAKKSIVVNVRKTGNRREGAKRTRNEKGRRKGKR